jgi:hypothetical protein
MSNTNTNTTSKPTNPPQQNRQPNNNQQQSRGPKSIWVVRPQFTLGECRLYFSKDDAIKDFGVPLEKWDTKEDSAEIYAAPPWDDSHEISWILERLEVRSLKENQ